MPKDQRTFTQEFKQEAVRLVQTSGKSITQVARDLGIVDSTLHHWCKLVAEHQQEYPVKTMCRILEVSESGYYAWKKRAPSQRSLQDVALGERIAQAYHTNRQVYGSPRIHAVLRSQGEACGRKRGRTADAASRPLCQATSASHPHDR